MSNESMNTIIETIGKYCSEGGLVKSEIKDDALLEMLGIHSLVLIRIFVELEEIFDIEFSDDENFQLAAIVTYKELVDRIQQIVDAKISG
ncbi:acyl carrier protein [Paenibacillus pabuli]|uniref:acyl carrier protein n=1 Tax=Paenibacillus pabuli TaxID=1472 RepID=UPI003CECE09E